MTVYRVDITIDLPEGLPQTMRLVAEELEALGEHLRNCAREYSANKPYPNDNGAVNWNFSPDLPKIEVSSEWLPLGVYPNGEPLRR